MKSIAGKTGILILSALLWSVTAQAQETGKSLAEKLEGKHITIKSSVKGCEADIKEHCDGLGNNTRKVFMCLAAYEDQLDPQCKKGILDAAISIKLGAAAMEYSISACEADADTHCLDVEPGEGRLLSCIKAHEADVSKQCTKALKKTGLWDTVQ
jgi:hypothetical protein